MMHERERETVAGERTNLTVSVEVPVVEKVCPGVLLDQTVLGALDDGGKSEGQDEDGGRREHGPGSRWSVGMMWHKGEMCEDKP